MKKAQKQNKIIEFFKSPISIIIYLMILVVILLGFNYYLARRNALYIFNAYTDEFTFMDGSIYIGGDINNLTAPKILYSGDEILLDTYEMGYYIKDGEAYAPISVVTNNEDIEDTVKLSELINVSEFSFSETHNGAGYFSKENLKLIDNFCFRISGTNQNGEEVSIEIPLEVVKITK